MSNCIIYVEKGNGFFRGGLSDSRVKEIQDDPERNYEIRVVRSEELGDFVGRNSVK